MRKKSLKNLKGAEEIRKDLESIKKEIGNRKNQSDKEAKEFLIDLDASISKKVSEIENQKRELESKIKQNFDKAYGAGKKFVGAFKNYHKIMMSVFRGILIAFFLSVISVILLVFHGNVFSIISIIFSVIIFFVFYRKIVKITKFGTKEMEDAVKIFGTSPSLRDFKIPQRIQTEKTSRLAKLRQVFGGLLVSVGKFIPGIDTAYVELTLLAKFQKNVKEFESTLEYYNIKLISDPHFFENLKKYAPAGVRIIDDESFWEKAIVEKITSELKRDQRDISNDVIKLLYKEHNGRNTRSIFRTIREDKKALKNLASLLFRSERLTKAPGTLSYDPEDVSTLLKSVEDFDLSQVNNLLSKTIRQLGYIRSYKDYLEMNGIRVDFNPTLRFTLEKVDSNISSFEGQIIDLCYKFGLICFKKITSKELSEGFARASISIKFNSEVSLRKPACEISSNYLAVAVIRAYFEKVKERVGELATLEDLLKDLSKINSFIKKRNDIDSKFLESKLKEGKWYDSTSDYLKAYVEEKAKELKTEIEKVHKYKVLEEAIRKTFEQVKIVTIEKAIDAQVFSAYLIMTHSTAGGFAPLIDKLSLRDLEKIPERRWEFKNKDTIEEIKTMYGVTPRYDFMKYSRSTWVGVLDKGEEFTEFKNNFLGNLKKALKKTKLEFNIGLVLQRITPSKYSFGILDDVPENVNIKDLEIARYVARLASDHIPREEQASVMTFDRDVDLLKILNKKSIFELIRVENDDITDRERKILESQSLKKEVLSELETKLGVKSFKSLALDLAKNVIPEHDISRVVTNVFKNELRRANILSNRFVNVLKDLAVLYELQRK